MIPIFHLISLLYSKKKLNNDLSVLINALFVSISGDSSKSRKRRLSVIKDHEVLASDSGFIAGDFISKFIIDDEF
jgi:hypothetical protein